LFRLRIIKVATLGRVAQRTADKTDQGGGTDARSSNV